MELYVIRHGVVPSNEKGIISGRNNECLTALGIEQSEEVREQIKDISFDAIYSSPVLRAVQTANIVNVQHLKIQEDERLAERDPGKMLGMERKKIDVAAWNSLVFDRTPEGAETLKAGILRTKSFLDEIREKYTNKKVLIVTHNFICKCIWILENHIVDEKEIAQFIQKNSEIRIYHE